jgi:hypothetical protein
MVVLVTSVVVVVNVVLPVVVVMSPSETMTQFWPEHHFPDPDWTSC